MPSGEGDTSVFHIRVGSQSVTTRTGGWRIRWKLWANISKIYVVGVLVDLFWARLPQVYA